MSTTDVIGIVIAVVVVGAFAVVAVRGMRRRKLRERFGEEYERAVDEKGGRSAAEAELRRRERRHASLDLHELSDAERHRFRDGWVAVQAMFVDAPVTAVREGDRLVTDLVTSRGYPVSNYQDRLADLSVEHANVLSHYRDAHEISERNDAGTATTEELRKALVHYRELFADLLGEEPVTETPDNAATGARSNATAGASEPVAGTPVAPVAEMPVEPTHTEVPAQAASADAPPVDDETRSGATAGESVRTGARGSASHGDASAPHTHADEA